MEAAKAGPEDAEGGSDGDDSDDEVAAPELEEEQETEEELLAQCDPVVPPRCLCPY